MPYLHNEHVVFPPSESVCVPTERGPGVGSSPRPVGYRSTRVGIRTKNGTLYPATINDPSSNAIHLSSWNRNSANFALKGFSEVRIHGVLGSLARRCPAKLAEHVSDGPRRTLPTRATFRWLPLHPSRNTIEGTLMEGGSKWTRFCGTDRARIDEIGAARSDRRTTNQSNEKGTATMKLTTTTQVSVDGVMQGPGGPEEDERGVFERGGWAHFDNEAGTVMDEIYQRADAFLFGRRTYEIFAGSWGTWDDPGDSPIWTALNTKPKYVASTTLTDPRWTNTTVLSSEVAAAVGELKAKPGGELQVHGSGALFRWLLDNDLVDEMNLFTFPVVVGQGTRLFPDTGRDRALELVESRATPSGVTIQVYRPTGRPQYETATPDLNT
jgi:dihydrofolate reductase